MNFNPDPTKQDREIIIFSQKTKKIFHLSLKFNDASVSQSLSQKSLGIILNIKLILDEHLKMVYSKYIKPMHSSGNYKICYQEMH